MSSLQKLRSCGVVCLQGLSFSELCFIRKTYKENYVLYLCLACPEGWFENGNQCYFILPQKTNTFEGYYRCKQLNATLPVIKSAEQNAFLTSLMERRGNTRLGMIAPKGDNVFEWLDGTLVADTFSAWNSGEPNNAGSENCAILFVSRGGKGKWNNDGCCSSEHIVCQTEKTEFNPQLL